MHVCRSASSTVRYQLCSQALVGIDFRNIEKSLCLTRPGQQLESESIFDGASALGGDELSLLASPLTFVLRSCGSHG
ncbi:hypothetical protein VTK73DRAFT_10236 [Phialemonium thermophilum]|uniref:Uncharacterized protein n=1 Tax=Phialemonium thermophilum TaxID=223376 RepID=A0ABR3XI04_9PEZI